MYKTMAEATTPRPDVSAMVEKANFAAAKDLHHERMKDVRDSIKAHYFWESFSRFSPSLSSQYCWDCGETISSEFDMRRHRGLCALKARLAKEDFDGPWYTCMQRSAELDDRLARLSAGSKYP